MRMFFYENVSKFIAVGENYRSDRGNDREKRTNMASNERWSRP